MIQKEMPLEKCLWTFQRIEPKTNMAHEGKWQPKRVDLNPPPWYKLGLSLDNPYEIVTLLLLNFKLFWVSTEFTHVK